MSRAGEKIAHADGTNKGFSMDGAGGGDTAVNPCVTTISRWPQDPVKVAWGESEWGNTRSRELETGAPPSWAVSQQLEELNELTGAGAGAGQQHGDAAVMPAIVQSKRDCADAGPASTSAMHSMPVATAQSRRAVTLDRVCINLRMEETIISAIVPL